MNKITGNCQLLGFCLRFVMYFIKFFFQLCSTVLTKDPFLDPRCTIIIVFDLFHSNGTVHDSMDDYICTQQIEIDSFKMGTAKANLTFLPVVVNLFQQFSVKLFNEHTQRP